MPNEKTEHSSTVKENNLAKMRPKQGTQTIQFTGSEEESSFEVSKNEVTIHPSTGRHYKGSSKVKLKNIVDFSWDHIFYTGQLVAVHISGKYLAYGIRGVANNTGVVRVVNRETEERALIKGMVGMIRDLAFAHIPTQVTLATTDEYGNLFVHQIEERGSKLQCTAILQVLRNSETASFNHRVIWCPYIPEDPGDKEGCEAGYEEVAKLLVLTHDEKSEVWNVNTVAKQQGPGPWQVSEIKDGFTEVNEHIAPILDAAFSPDGTALATASSDGYVKFFQVSSVYMYNDSSPRCLHEWKPHDGKPVTSLFFLDNHKTYNTDEQFWKYALTGANKNSELKIWSCESWTCLQTIIFEPSVGSSPLALKAGLDMCAGFLLLSDIYKEVLYILELYKDASDSVACVTSVTEFLLPYPLLSFGIVDAGPKKLKQNCISLNHDDVFVDKEECDDDVEQTVEGVVVKMYIVSPKSLQDCHIVFRPAGGSHTQGNNTASTLSQDSLAFRDGFSDLSSISASNSELELAEPGEAVAIPPVPPPPLTLMTPDDFSSPSMNDSVSTGVASPVTIKQVTPKSSPSTSKVLEAVKGLSPAASLSPVSVSLSHTSQSEMFKLSSNAGITQAVEVNGDASIVATSETNDLVLREAFASGGSSPSREVQEILGPKSTGNECLNEDFSGDEGDKLSEQATPTPLKDFSSEAEVSHPVIAHQPNGKSANSSPELILPSQQSKWPQIPSNLTLEPLKTETLSRSQRSDTLDACGDMEREVVGPEMSTEPVGWTPNIDSRLNGLSEDVRSLLHVIKEQQVMIQELQHEVRRLHSSSLTEEMISSTVRVIVDESFSQHSVRQSERMNEVLSLREAKEKERQDNVLSAVTQTVANTVGTRLEMAVKGEMKNSVMPAVTRILESLKQQLQYDIVKRVSDTDMVLKDSILKMVQSKPLLDSLSHSTALALQDTYRELFQTVFVPSFEKVFQNMFFQLNETFGRGTKEYVQNLEGHLDKIRQLQDTKGIELFKHMQGIADGICKSNEQVAVAVQNEMRNQLPKALNSSQDRLAKRLREVVQEQLTKSFQEQQSIEEKIRSRAVTPATPNTDPHVLQLHLMQLLDEGQVNTAFQQALSYSDINLVLYLCEKVNPHELFNKSPCPLQQHVLLSLIQQLSVNLSYKTELKHKFLEEAVMNLDPLNHVTREHMPNVLTNLQHQIQVFASEHSTHKLVRSMRMLSMATNALFNKN